MAETSDNFEAGLMCVTSGWGLTHYLGESQSEKSKAGIQRGGVLRLQVEGQITERGSDHRKWVVRLQEEGQVTGPW